MDRVHQSGSDEFNSLPSLIIIIMIKKSKMNKKNRWRWNKIMRCAKFCPTRVNCLAHDNNEPNKRRRKKYIQIAYRKYDVPHYYWAQNDDDGHKCTVLHRCEATISEIIGCNHCTMQITITKRTNEMGEITHTHTQHSRQATFFFLSVSLNFTLFTKYWQNIDIDTILCDYVAWPSRAHASSQVNSFLQKKNLLCFSLVRVCIVAIQ